MKTEIISIRVNAEEKEYLNIKAKEKGYKLSEYGKKALLNFEDNENKVLFNRKEFVKSYIKLKDVIDSTIVDDKCRLLVKAELEELVCQILS